MIERIISGGQTGADQAGWRAANRFGLATWGWMPQSYMTEDGPRPDLARLYGAGEAPYPGYPARTRPNVANSDAVLWFGNPATPGGRLTSRLAIAMNKDWLVVVNGREVDPSEIAGWTRDGCCVDVMSLMVAGNRESKAPGIGAWVEEYLCEVFRCLGLEEIAPPKNRD